MNKKFIEHYLKTYRKTKGEKHTKSQQIQRVANINYLIGYADGKGYKLDKTV